MNSWHFIQLDTPTIMAVIAVAVAFAGQLLLCYKAKKLWLKLLPVSILVVSTIVFCILSACVNGWDGLGYLFFALLSFGMLFVSGIAFLIWAIARKRNQ